MRSPRSVKRPHTNHHTTNVRRNRGKQVKNSRMRHKQWAHALVYSPDVAEKRQIFTLTSLPIIKEVSDEERARRAERKKEKKMTAKLNDDEARRLELERKEKEREERKQKREEERKRQEELEYQKWQEAQKKKEEELAKAEAERKAAEKRAAEERKKEAAQAAQAEAKKEKAKKEKKTNEGGKAPTSTADKVEVTPVEAPTAPAQKPAEEVQTEKKKKKKEKEHSVEKEAHVKAATPTETTPPVTTPPVEVHDEEKHTKKKGGKGKKASESESGLHNGHNEPTLTNEVHIDEGHGKHEAHGKKGKKGKKAEHESADVANGHVVNAAVDEPTHVIDSAPVEDVPNGGLVQLDGEKKKGKGKKHETTSPEPSVVSHTSDVSEKGTTNEISHSETIDHEEKHGKRSGEESSAKKNKHKEKKGKHTSPESEITKVTVVSKAISSMNDVPAATTDKASPPIQVHEVTSTAHENGTRETVHTITTTLTTAPTTSPTQFAQNVERLVSHTLNKAKHDIVEIDPNVKVTIDAQLVKLSEKKPETTNDHKIHITPLPLELHYSRPTTPSNRERVYKLLPRDIIFCSSLIDSHGEDYAAMAADPKNIYKENARAIQRKVRIFKESPHYQTYLRAKEEGRSVEEILAEEGQT